VFNLVRPHKNRFSTIGLVGVGTGATIAYAEPHQSWSLYEIDADVIDMSTAGGHFTFLEGVTAPPRLRPSSVTHG